MYGKSFRVNSRRVGANPGDPDGLRRSQRAVLDLVFNSDAPVMAFVAPTGAGKSHILRTIAARNTLAVQAHRLICCFPLHILVKQQAMEIHADHLDTDGAYELIRKRAVKDPEGEEARILKDFLSTCTLPPSYRNSAMIAEMLESDPRKAVALTPDSFDLVVKGVMQALAKDLDLAGLRSLIRRALRTKVSNAVIKDATADIEKEATSNHVGPKTATKIRHLLRQHIPPKALTRGEREQLIIALITYVIPEDPTPGPKYTYSKQTGERIAELLRGALVVFDEFHLLAGKPAFAKMVNRLIKLGARVLFMSGTPRWDFLAQWNTQVVDFDQWESPITWAPDEPTTVFNNPMDVVIEAAAVGSASYDPMSHVIPALQTWSSIAPGPTLLIFDAVERALKVHSILKRDYPARQVLLWTGPEKDSTVSRIISKDYAMAPDALVVGTSALEMGVDLPFRNLLSEVQYLDATLQRIGRIGRMGSVATGQQHHVLLLLRRGNLQPEGFPAGAVERRDLADVLERILQVPAHRPDDEYEGLWLRGNQQSQILAVSLDNGRVRNVARGSQTLLRIYPPAIPIPDWHFLKPKGKWKALVERSVPKEDASRIVFHELYKGSSTAYISHGGTPLTGKVESAIQDGPRGSTRAIRVWSVGGRVVMQDQVTQGQRTKREAQPCPV